MAAKTAFGFQRPQSANSDVNSTTFLVQQMLARVNTVTLVTVVGVTNAGGISPVGSVDVVPLVNQIDGAGNVVPHGTIFGLPYFRIQGGANAIILDPQVGDIGIAGFASRDISAVKASRAPAPPGSFRRFNYADGLYFGGTLNGTPTQYVAFTPDGVDIVSPGTINIAAAGGTTIDGKPFLPHRHAGVQTGDGDTGGVA